MMTTAGATNSQAVRVLLFTRGTPLIGQAKHRCLYADRGGGTAASGTAGRVRP